MRTPKPDTCSGCPANGKGLGFISPTHPKDLSKVKLALVGQGPGEQEYETSIPFFEYAPSGSILTKWLHRAAILRSRCWVGNTIQCYLPKGYRGGRPWGSEDPTKAMQQFCWDQHVGPSLHSLPNLKFLVPIGTPARHFFMGSDKGERYCGTYNKGELPPLPAGEKE